MTEGIGKLGLVSRSDWTPVGFTSSTDIHLLGFAATGLKALAADDAKALEAASRAWVEFLEKNSPPNIDLLRRAPEALWLLSQGRDEEAKRHLPQNVDSATLRRISHEIERRQVMRHRAAIDEIVESLARAENPGASMMGEPSPQALRDKFKAAHPRVYEQFTSLGNERDPRLFSQTLYRFGLQLKSENEDRSAFFIFSYLSRPDKDWTAGIWRDEALRGSAAEEASAMTGVGPHRRGKRWSYLLNSIGADDVAMGINSFGAVAGLTALLSSRLRILRPFSAGGIKLLSDPRMASTLLAAGGYSLYRQAPLTYEAAGRLLSGHSSASPSQPTEDLLTVLGFGVGVLGFSVGVGSFAMGAKNFARMREIALVEGYAAREASLVAFKQGDAVRRAVMDPQIWSYFGRNSSRLNPWQRGLLIAGGDGVNYGLSGGAAVVGAGRLGLGINRLLGNDPQNPNPGWSDLGALFYHFALDVYPAVTMHLYRAGRGDPRFNLGSALSHELLPGYDKNPKLREIALARREEGVPSLSPQGEIAFRTQLKTVVRDQDRSLTKASGLERAFPVENELWIRQAAEAISNLPSKSKPVKYGKTAREVPDADVARKRFSALSMQGQRKVYENGEISPVGMLNLILSHRKIQDGAVFPRPLHRGSLNRHLVRLAEASQKRFEKGEARPLEGVFVAVKDLFPDLDGQMQFGSRTSRMAGVEASPLVRGLMELGAIPIPVGMVAAANGGTGDHSGYGYIRHPTRRRYDPAGSSNATAFVVGLKDMPIVVGIGTDTGGSVIAPAGVTGLVGLVPPAGVLSMKNMAPFATHLDRPGIIAQHPQDAWTLCRMLARWVVDDPHLHFDQPGSLFHVGSSKPRIAYLESVVKQASPESREHFLRKMADFKRQGYEVKALDAPWDFLAEFPMQIYPVDSYAAVLMAYTNPLKGHRFDPPRRTLDRNLLIRLPKGDIALREGYYDRARTLSDRYLGLVREKLGADVVLASPATEAIRTAPIKAGKAGEMLDGHDRITMAKNRIPEWGQLTLPALRHEEGGIAMSGALKDLMQLQESFFRPAPRTPPAFWADSLIPMPTGFKKPRVETQIPLD